MMPPNPNKLTDKEFLELKKQIKENKSFRKRLCSSNHFWFFYVYFTNHILYEPAPFHYELFDISQDLSISLAAITAFRGSGKSTIMSLSYPIWAILGVMEKKYILLISQVQQQATQVLANIKSELETNQLLIEDFGPFEEIAGIWNTNTITLSKYNARITSLSTGTNIRGLRQNQFRPQLIVCDDIESLESVKNIESRNNTYKWFTQDVLPSGDKNTKVVVIGNLLHEDSLQSRLKEKMLNEPNLGNYREYPLLDDNNECLWPSKFPTVDDINKVKNSVFDEPAWYREYLLRIISDASRIIYPEWIQYYEDLPITNCKEYKMTAVGVDLAISERTTADYTAIVTARLYEYDNTPKIYILPNIINKRLNFADAGEAVAAIVNLLGHGSDIKIYVESVGYQEALSQHLRTQGYRVESVNPKGDKTVRLSGLAPLIKSGVVLFPKKGAELQITQITNFGVEKHDDLADALGYAVDPLIKYAHRSRARVWTRKPSGW